MTAPERDPRLMEEPRCPGCGSEGVAIFSDAPDTDAADHWECGDCCDGCCARGDCGAAS